MGRDSGLAVVSVELCASIRPGRDENPGRQERGPVGMLHLLLLGPLHEGTGPVRETGTAGGQGWP